MQQDMTQTSQQKIEDAAEGNEAAKALQGKIMRGCQIALDGGSAMQCSLGNLSMQPKMHPDVTNLADVSTAQGFVLTQEGTQAHLMQVSRSSVRAS